MHSSEDRQVGKPEATRVAGNLAEPALSLRAVERLVEEHLPPIREDLDRLKRDLARRHSP